MIVKQQIVYSLVSISYSLCIYLSAFNRTSHRLAMIKAHKQIQFVCDPTFSFPFKNLKPDQSNCLTFDPLKLLFILFSLALKKIEKHKRFFSRSKQTTGNFFHNRWLQEGRKRSDEKQKQEKHIFWRNCTTEKHD